METIVTGEGDQPSPSDGHGEEDLDGRVLPNLFDIQTHVSKHSNCHENLSYYFFTSDQPVILENQSNFYIFFFY